MKDQLVEQYNEVMAGQALSDRQKKEAEASQTSGSYNHIPEGTVWSLREWQFDGRPYVKVTCSGCKQIVATSDLNFVLRHCKGPEPIPEELRAKLERLLIKKGLLKVKPETFLERLFSKEQPAGPNLNAF